MLQDALTDASWKFHVALARWMKASQFNLYKHLKYADASRNILKEGLKSIEPYKPTRFSGLVVDKLLIGTLHIQSSTSC